MPIVQADRLTRVGSALLKAAGASEEEADAVAVGCVNANLAGHDSHGVIAIPTYIDRITAGHIVPGATWTIVQKSPTTTVIDGHWGFGFHVNAKAMALTIEKAKTANVAARTVFRQSHGHEPPNQHPYYLSGCNVWPTHPDQIADKPREAHYLAQPSNIARIQRAMRGRLQHEAAQRDPLQLNRRAEPVLGPLHRPL